MRGSIKQYQPGVWYLRVEVGRDPSGGRRRRIREVVHGTKSEAQRRLRELLRSVETGMLIDERRITIAQVAERWLLATQHRVSARSFATYRERVENHIAPALGALRAESLRPAHVEGALASWMAPSARCDRHRDRTERLSSQTVSQVFATFRSMCRWALKMNLVARNPCDAVSPPRVFRREMTALGPSGVADLLTAARGTELESLIVVAVGTGLRRAELLGLRWPDVDVNAGRLAVRRSVEMVKGGGRREKAPKTARSARTVALAAFVAEALRRQRKAQLERRLVLGLGRDDAAFVFDRLDGTPWSLHAFSTQFARLAKRAGIRVRLHDLRHSFATLALAAGVDLKTVSTSLGHSSISITANVYLHAVESLEADAARRVDAALGGAVQGALSGPAHEGSGPRRAQKAAPLGREPLRKKGSEPLDDDEMVFGQVVDTRASALGVGAGRNRICI